MTSEPPAESTARRRRADLRRYLLVLFFIVALTVADQASKAWVAANVPFGRAISYLGGLVVIIHSYNPGTLAGFCSGGAWYPLPGMILAGGTLALLLTAIFPVDRLLHKLLASGDRDLGRRPAAPVLPAADAAGSPDSRVAPTSAALPPAEATPSPEPAASFLGFGPRADAVFAALALPGAIGNVVDRFHYTGRGVLDFLSIGIGAHRWPTFNVADICLTVVMLLAVPLVFASFMESPRRDRGGEQAPDTLPAGSEPSSGFWRKRGRAFLRGELTLLVIVAVLGLVGYCCESFQPLRRLVLHMTSSRSLRLVGAGVAIFLFAAYVRTEIQRWRSR